jgi:hypothetical protein
LEGQETLQWSVSPTNGQVESMNRTIKEATVKRFHYDDHAQLETHLDDFIAAIARRLSSSQTRSSKQAPHGGQTR